MKMNFSSLRLSSSWQASQLLANLNKSSQNLCTILCRIKLTFEEEEKLLLIEWPVFVRDMEALVSPLSPSPDSLIESPILGHLRQRHPWLELKILEQNVFIYLFSINYYLRRLKT